MKQRIEETLAFLKSRTKLDPQILIILGSGFGEIAKKINADIIIPYSEIPYFRKAKAPTHEGNLVFGRWHRKQVMIMQGRIHAYEGYDSMDLMYPVRIAGELGVKLLITTNLSGGINENFKVGDIMLVEDHINLSGINFLAGYAIEGKTEFVDMFEAYSPRLIILFEEVARSKGFNIHRGVLAYLTGPAFETQAELKFFKMIGANAVGWSIVPEVLMARRIGMEVIGICYISDISDPERVGPVYIKEIFEAGLKKSKELYSILDLFISQA